MKTLIISICLFTASWLQAQPSIKVEVSADTIPIGEIVEVTYTIENGQGEFIPPDFSDLPLVNGPNTSSSFVYENGKMTSSQSYAYLFRPEAEGKLKIPAAGYKDKTGMQHVDAVEIVVNRFGQKSVAKKIAPGAEPAKPTREKRKF